MAYKVFTNGSPLPASDLNTYLMNQSVMVFADAAARSAALTSPTEGMVSYTQDNNKTQYYDGAAWQDLSADTSTLIPKSTVTTTGDLIVANGNASVTRLGIGTNGQYLSSNGTTATWTTPSSGGMTLLASGSLVGASQANLTSISSSYKSLNLRIFNSKYDSAAMSYGVELNGSTNSNYRQSQLINNSSSVSEANTTRAYFYLGYSAANKSANFDIWLPGYAGTAKPRLFHYSYAVDDNFNSSAGFGNFNENGAISAIRFYNLSSYNFTTGTYELYGVQ